MAQMTIAGRTRPARPARMGRRRARKVRARTTRGGRGSAATRLNPECLAKLNCAQIILGHQVASECIVSRRTEGTIRKIERSMGGLLKFWKDHGLVKPADIDNFLYSYKSPDSQDYARLKAVAERLRMAAAESVSFLGKIDSAHPDTIRDAALILNGQYRPQDMQEILSRVRARLNVDRSCHAAMPWNGFTPQALASCTGEQGMAERVRVIRGRECFRSTLISRFWDSLDERLKATVVIAGIIVEVALFLYGVYGAYCLYAAF